MSGSKVSVIIPVYKVEKYLEQCVDSVLNQNYPDLEVILVDDGSPDQSPEICDRYAREYDYVKVIHKENGGLSSARNCGIKEAIGKYIMFLDSDDWWNENVKLELMIQKLEQLQDIEMACFSGLEYISGTGLAVRKDKRFYEQEEGLLEKCDYYAKVIALGNLQESACTKILSRRFLIDNHLFFQEGILGEDTEWMFRVLRTIKQVAIMSEPLFVCRNAREGSITSHISARNVRDMIQVISQSVDYYENNRNNPLQQYEFAHCAYLWFIGLSMLAKLSRQERKPYQKEMKKYKFLLNYANSKKVRLSKIALAVLGMGQTASLLDLYVELGKKNIIKKREKI